MRDQVFLVLCVPILGCGEDALERVTAPYGSATCFPTDEACPADPPRVSGPCRQGLACEYPADGGEGDWSFHCEEGQWQVRPSCSDAPSCPFPPLAELCDDPLDRGLEGGRIEVGPVDLREPFRPFEPGESIEPVSGPDDRPALAFRVRITGVEPPQCVVLRRDVRAAGTPPREPGGTRLRLRCGESLAVLDLLEADPNGCAADRDLTLWASVQGIGGTQVDLSIPPGLTCPARAR